jgi:tRNA G18 (ribose-2'-O)-methylase SpoU
MRGFFGIGIYHPKTEMNVGTLWRTAYQLGAAFVFTVGQRYREQCSDTLKTWRHVPLLHYADAGDLVAHLPHDCRLIAVEMGGRGLVTYCHPERCVYLLGAEDYGLPPIVRTCCHGTISIGAVRTLSYNVAVAGALVMYDRYAKDMRNGEGPCQTGM